MKLQRLLSLTRQAVDQYHMIDQGDHIAVGVSGGKDSLTLLYALYYLKKFYPNHFQLSAISVDLGFDGFDLSPVLQLCDEFQIPCAIVPSHIGSILFESRKESNPCSLCAKLRKGALNAKAKELGCNKVAYAHHKDDLIETMLLSLIYEGRFHTFSPVTYLDRIDLSVIRPMIYVDESDIKGFRNKFQLPVCPNPCPVDGHTKREYVKNITKVWEKENPGVKTRLFHAITHGNLPGWTDCSP